MAPSKKQVQKMSSSYLPSNGANGITGGLNVAGHIEANKINNAANGNIAGTTPTNLGNSSSFLRHQ